MPEPTNFGEIQHGAGKLGSTKQGQFPHTRKSYIIYPYHHLVCLTMSYMQVRVNLVQILITRYMNEDK